MLSPMISWAEVLSTAEDRLGDDLAERVRAAGVGEALSRLTRSVLSVTDAVSTGAYKFEAATGTVGPTTGL